MSRPSTGGTPRNPSGQSPRRLRHRTSIVDIAAFTERLCEVSSSTVVGLSLSGTATGLAYLTVADDTRPCMDDPDGVEIGWDLLSHSGKPGLAQQVLAQRLELIWRGAHTVASFGPITRLRSVGAETPTSDLAGLWPHRHSLIGDGLNMLDLATDVPGAADRLTEYLVLHGMPTELLPDYGDQPALVEAAAAAAIAARYLGLVTWQNLDISALLAPPDQPPPAPRPARVLSMKWSTVDGQGTARPPHTRQQAQHS